MWSSGTNQITNWNTINDFRKPPPADETRSPDFKILTRPGVWLQNVTTKEPDDKQLEVAIEALKESLKLEPTTGEPQPAPLS